MELMSWKEAYRCDLFRKKGRTKPSLLDRFCFELRLMKLFRKANSAYRRYVAKKSVLLKLKYRFSELRLLRFENKFGVNLSPATDVGLGFFVGHRGPMAINPKSKIGKNCNIGICVTIGQENRGKRKGSPVIGDCVWIGSNAIIVGNIKIGNNVLIAPGSYVNFNVPSNSIVIGNPGKIIPSINATESYIENLV